MLVDRVSPFKVTLVVITHLRRDYSNTMIPFIALISLFLFGLVGSPLASPVHQLPCIDYYYDFTDDYCATQLFSGRVDANHARSILRTALELLEGITRPNRRSTIYDGDAQRLLRMMTNHNFSAEYEPPAPQSGLKRSRTKDPEYTPPEGSINQQREISVATAHQILDMIASGNSPKTIKAKYPWFQNRYLERIERIVELNSPEPRQSIVNRQVKANIDEARQAHHVVRGWMIRMWGMNAARDVGLTNFRASVSWMESFQRRNRIVSRKITEFRSRRQQEQAESLPARALQLSDDFSARRQLFRERNILNFDQSGFQYEMTTGRVVSFEKRA